MSSVVEKIEKDLKLFFALCGYRKSFELEENRRQVDEKSEAPL